MNGADQEAAAPPKVVTIGRTAFVRDEDDTPKAIPEVVERLEDLLERAKAGELVGFAYSTQLRGGAWSTGWTAEVGPALLGSIEYLGHRLKNRMDADGE